MTRSKFQYILFKHLLYITMSLKKCTCVCMRTLKQKQTKNASRRSKSRHSYRVRVRRIAIFLPSLFFTILFHYRRNISVSYSQKVICNPHRSALALSSIFNAYKNIHRIWSKLKSATHSVEIMSRTPNFCQQLLKQ